MFEAEYLIFCESKGVDDKGRLSLINIFDTIYASAFPTAHPQLKVITKLTATTKAVVDKEVTIKVTTTIGDEEVSKLEGASKVTIEKGNSLVPELDLAQFVFPRGGDYSVNLYVNDKLLVARILKIRSADELAEK